MNSAADAVVASCACPAESSCKFLQKLDVLVVKNRCDQFALFAVRSCNADVLLEFPFSSLCVPCAESAVSVAESCVLASARSEEVGGNFCGFFTADAVHFNFNSNAINEKLKKMHKK